MWLRDGCFSIFGQAVQVQNPVAYQRNSFERYTGLFCTE